ncbi:SRPBCC family protein [Aeromicrobium wangtongii]|uniref:SRPBCC family protein n=1 Tax=Aeromicrobium wangtongii TaxID=2969247 RepID=A0ABY5M8F9_9ACTN|nr:SRPBCC family protein [Aeromicrobium wangtongii]MCD9198915.1 SRPBCC family protein [Aeromicrobium wangtongii]MCL3819824.1 SRPBCC family protein [Aeromicrobium wangtongii]UUP13047.1 SRPBCC family protein [Aeromicrobium wangtongii]
MHVERTFTVSRSVEDVFDYLSNFENTNQWDPGTIRTERTAGDGGLGTTYANRSRFAGRETDLTYETIGFDRPTFFCARGMNKTATATDSMTFTRDGDRTQIHYRADFQFHGPVRFVAPLVVKPKLAALADETVEQIRRSLEPGTS